MNLKSPRLTKSLLEKIFIAASIRRWNDQATPVEFSELDKQAHKMVIAYFLAREEEKIGNTIDWERLIQQFCFEFFERVVLTDIKPPVFYELVKGHNKELVNFVCDALKDDLKEYGFYPIMREYLLQRNEANKNIESQILQAAHRYASKWEFDIIYDFAPKLPGVGGIKKKLDEDVEGCYNINGIRSIKLYKKYEELISMFGQLRFQKRWSQTPRIPATSVLGHTLVVALSGYLLSLDLGCVKSMRINHFLCGLFHDLPEILTRDIISPIKHNIVGLDEHIKQIEEKYVEEKILSKVTDNPAIREDIKYFTQNEFSNRIKIEGFTQIVSAQDIMSKYNNDEANAVYGEFLKICDNLGAYLEAKISISHGISSKDLVNGAEGILKNCGDRVICDVDIGKIFRDWK